MFGPLSTHQRIYGSSQGATNNPHVLDERVMNNAEDSGVDEEDKYVTYMDSPSAIRYGHYGAVFRGPNVYIPPEARKNPVAAATPSTSGSATVNGPDVPKVSINAPDGSNVTHFDTTTPASPSKAPRRPSVARASPPFLPSIVRRGLEKVIVLIS
jgi:PAB1-binding protein PBP1